MDNSLTQDSISAAYQSVTTNSRYPIGRNIWETGGMMTMSDSDYDFLEVQKQVERDIIRLVLAPAILAKKDRLLSESKEQMSTVATDTKTSFTSAIGNIEEYMKGKLSDSVKESATTINNEYGNL